MKKSTKKAWLWFGALVVLAIIAGIIASHLNINQ